MGLNFPAQKGARGQGRGGLEKRPLGLTMKRMFAPPGFTLLRSSLWRFTYSLIKSTSSSCGRDLAFKLEPNSSIHNSQSCSFQKLPSARGSNWEHLSGSEGLGAFMILLAGQVAAHAPARPCALPIRGAVLGNLGTRKRKWK